MIALYGCSAGTNTIVQIDDPSVFLDEGATFINVVVTPGTQTTPFFQTAAIDQGPAGRQGRIRRIVQTVVLGGDCSVRVQPVVDGSMVSAQAETFALVTSDGPTQTVETFPAVNGTRFQIRVQVTALGGVLAFGEADVVVVPTRTTASA